MRFQGIRLVEQLEQKFRRFESVSKKNKPGPAQVGAISKAQK